MTGEEEHEIHIDPETGLQQRQDDNEWPDKLEELLERNDPAALNDFLNQLFPADLARLVLSAGFEQGRVVLETLDPETRGEVLLELDDPQRRRYLDALSSTELANIVQAQESDEAVDLLAEMDQETVSEVLSQMPLEERINVAELLSYPENSAGSIMAKEFVAVHENDTVKKAIQTIRKISKEADDIHTVYVLDKEDKYRGHVNLNRLILANTRTRVKRIMEEDLLPIPVEMDREEVANFFTKYSFISAPVVDTHGVMLGRITVDDILDVVQEEASEDILRMGGVGGDETLTTPLLSASLNRITWLAVNLLTAFLASSVVRFFEDTISKVVVLAALMPIVAGMGGNAATQTIAIIVRNIALGQLSFANSSKALKREIILGILNGVTMGSITGVFVYFITGSRVLGGVICTAMITNMMVAAAAGTAIPVLLKRLNIDPAIASSIFVTTCTDVLGFFTFLGLAFLALPYIDGI